MYPDEHPLDEGRTLLANTALAFGYDEMTAMQLTQSALWLESCGAAGVAMMIRFMGATRQLSFDARKPRGEGPHGLTCLCPVMASNVITNALGESVPDGIFTLNGPAVPWLMAPLLIHYGKAHGVAVELHSGETTVRFCDDGFEVDEGEMGAAETVDLDCLGETEIRFVENFELPTPGGLQTIKLPPPIYPGAKTLLLI